MLKQLLCNILESGKSAICLDPEHELIDLCANLGGCFVDLMDGRYRINPLEPKAWSVDKKFYMDNLQLEGSEYEPIRYPQRGVCLYK